MTVKNPVMRLYFFGETWHLGGRPLRWISSNRCTSIMKKTILWSKVTLTFLHMLTIRGLHQNVWLGYFTPSRKRICKIRGTSEIWNKYPSSTFFPCVFWKKAWLLNRSHVFLRSISQKHHFWSRWVQALICRPGDKKGHPGGVVPSCSILSLCDKATKSEVSS